MRNIVFADDLRGDVTAPGYLLELTLGSTALRFSTRGQIQWNGQTWDRDMIVENIREISGGGVLASAKLNDWDGDIAALMLAADPRGAVARLFVGNDDQFITRMDGELIEVEEIGPEISIAMSSAGRMLLETPRIRLGPPFFDYVTPAGTIIDWNGERIILEGMNG